MLKAVILNCLSIVLFLGPGLFAGKLTPNGTDPTEIRNRFDLFLAEAKFTSMGDYMGIRASGLYALSGFSIGASLPMYYADLPDGKTYGIGDFGISGLFQIHTGKKERSYRRTALGLRLNFPSGNLSEGLGEGALSLDGYLAASFYPGDHFIIVPAVESTHTFGEQSAARRVHDVSLRVKNVFSLQEGHWVSITPEVFWDLRGDDQPLYVLSSTLGFMFDKQWALATDFTTPLAGYADFNSIGRLWLRYLID